MKGVLKTIIRISVVMSTLVILAFMSGIVFVVDETKQVVITQFGKPVGEPIADAGLHFKKPLIQQAHYFEKRLLEWDGDPNQIPTKDKKYIWVDTYARWRISDALKFLQSVNNEMNAHARLDDIINSATRDVITSHLLVEAIRNTNRILDTAEIEEDVSLAEEALESIEVGRSTLEELILVKASKLAPQYGIKLVDARIKRVNYVKEVRDEGVYLYWSDPDSTNGSSVTILGRDIEEVIDKLKTELILDDLSGREVLSAEEFSRYYDYLREAYQQKKQVLIFTRYNSTVYPDREEGKVKYDIIIKTMDQCRERGFPNVSLAG